MSRNCTFSYIVAILFSKQPYKIFRSVENTYSNIQLNTVVWEKFMARNIHEKKFIVKFFVLAGYR